MLVELTKQLLDWNEQVHQVFVRETKDADFKEEIQPFVEQVDRVLEEWRRAAESWVKKEHPKHIHLLQIEQVCENVRVNAVECFWNCQAKAFLRKDINL
ncbi:hypothetical protein GCM10020331_066960 [Ectobacillus funiculus]